MQAGQNAQHVVQQDSDAASSLPDAAPLMGGLHAESSALKRTTAQIPATAGMTSVTACLLILQLDSVC